MRLIPMNRIYHGAFSPSTRTTAKAAAASPAPTSPIPSFVLALTLTRPEGILQNPGDVFRHRRKMRGQFRLFQNDRRIHIADLITPRGGKRPYPFQQDQAGNAPIGGIRVRELPADVAQTDGAQDRVADGMDQDIGIRMAQKSLFVRDLLPRPEPAFSPPRDGGCHSRNRFSLFSPGSWKHQIPFPDSYSYQSHSRLFLRILPSHAVSPRGG